MRICTVLVVDDDPRNARLAQALLSSEGFAVSLAGDPITALDLLTRIRPDLILVDYLMPEMIGFEFANRVRNDPALARIPVLMTSAYSLEGDPRLHSCGCAGFIPKPVERSRLAAQVRNCIQNWRAAVCCAN